MKEKDAPALHVQIVAPLLLPEFGLHVLHAALPAVDLNCPAEHAVH